MWSTGEGNGKPLHYFCLDNPVNSMKRQKDMMLKDEHPRLVAVQYTIGEEWRNNYRKNEEAEPKQKQWPVVVVSNDGSKVWCCKEPYCIRTWNVSSMNQGELEVVKQEVARVNIDILGISEPKWKGMEEFNSNGHYIYYWGQESLRRNGVAYIVNKKVWNGVLVCDLKNDRLFLICYQGKPFNIMVIKVYAPTTNGEEVEVEWVYEDIWDVLELTHKKDILFIVGDWNAKVKVISQEIPGETGKFGLEIQNEEGQRLTQFCQENTNFHSKHPLPTTQVMSLHIDITRWSIPKSDWLCSLQLIMEKLYTVSKSKTRSWLWLRS